VYDQNLVRRLGRAQYSGTSHVCLEPGFGKIQSHPSIEAAVAVPKEDCLDQTQSQNIVRLTERYNLDLHTQFKILSFKDIEKFDFILALDHFTQAGILNQKWKVLKPRATIYMLRHLIMPRTV
jgi:hypothetical protein